MMTQRKQKTIFFQVNNNEQKLFRLTNLAKQKFDEKIPLLFLTQDTAAAIFVDKTLWSHPVHSLIPHEFSLNDSNEIICISIPPHNPNKALHIFNLTKEPLLSSPASTIYEFDDLTSNEKSQISKNKYHRYKEENFALASF